MKEFLSQRGVKFLEKDITTDEQALEELTATGYYTTPVTVIKDVVVVGFDKVKLAELLG